MEMNMGTTPDIDLNKELSTDDLKLPSELLTPEAKALMDKFYTPPVVVAEPPAKQPLQITYDQFKAVEIVVGRVVTASPVPKADKLVHMVVDLGAPRSAVNIVAGILKAFPDPSVLIGKTFAFVANLPPRQMRGIESQGMLLCAVDGEKTIPVEVPGAEVGARLS
jgi:methionine--tRNA ligase beta chain